MYVNEGALAEKGRDFSHAPQRERSVSWFDGLACNKELKSPRIRYVRSWCICVYCCGDRFRELVTRVRCKSAAATYSEVCAQQHFGLPSVSMTSASFEFKAEHRRYMKTFQRNIRHDGGILLISTYKQLATCMLKKVVWPKKYNGGGGGWLNAMVPRKMDVRIPFRLCAVCNKQLQWYSVASLAHHSALQTVLHCTIHVSIPGCLRI